MSSRQRDSDIRTDTIIAPNCRIVWSEEGLRIEKRYERLIKIFDDKEAELFDEWAATVPETVDIGLNRNILFREPDSTNTLALNFDPELLGVLKEVNYLKQMSRSDIPEHAIKVSLFSYSLSAFTFRIHDSKVKFLLTSFLLNLYQGVGKRRNVPQVPRAVVRDGVFVQQHPQDEQAGRVSADRGGDK